VSPELRFPLRNAAGNDVTMKQNSV
jgi:hypothetical protein